MRENLVLDLREAADKWRANHPAVMTFEIRYDLALCDAADAIEELQAQIDGWIEQERNALLKSIPKWIPVTERLPEPNAVDERGFVKAYLVKTDRHVMMHTARWDGMYWILWGQRTTLTDKVTHWMPLPEPPKEE